MSGRSGGFDSERDRQTSSSVRRQDLLNLDQGVTNLFCHPLAIARG